MVSSCFTPCDFGGEDTTFCQRGEMVFYFKENVYFCSQELSNKKCVHEQSISMTG
jgi:hypothetical protein